MATEPLSSTHPQLCIEWHPTRNENLKPMDVSKGSRKRVWWKCSKGHEWQAYIYSRAGKSSPGCPVCAKARVLEKKKNKIPPFEKSFAYLNPNASAEWDYTKNGEKGPRHYTAGSNVRVWWKCEKDHEWKTTISSRMKTGCPYCAGKKVSKEKSLGGKFPQLVNEWHPTKNNGKTPYDFMPFTHQKAWFICKEGHEWEAFIFNRSKGKGCPYCSGHKPTDETSLFAVNLDLCKEWNYEKNKDKHPSDFKPSSNEKVWWKCSKGHEWEAVISSRNNNRGCPECSKKSQTSFPEQAIFYYMKQLFPNAENRKRLDFLDSGSEADIYIPELNLAIEYDGYYHMNEKERDERKNYLMQKNHIQLIRIRQMVRKRKLPVLEGYGSFVMEHDYDNPHGIEDCLEEIFAYIQKKYGVSVPEMKIDSCRDRGEILKQIAEDERNLETLFPHLAEEWHPTKNGTLLPSQVSPFTHIKVWWKCNKNEFHEWEALVSNRSNGRTCPYCLNRKINDTNSLATLSPEIAKEWHPTKNGTLTPHQVALNYSKKVWWLCEVGHEWEATPNSRHNKKRKCPVCKKNIGSNKKERPFLD